MYNGDKACSNAQSFRPGDTVPTVLKNLEILGCIKSMHRMLSLHFIWFAVCLLATVVFFETPLFMLILPSNACSSSLGFLDFNSYTLHSFSWRGLNILVIQLFHLTFWSFVWVSFSIFLPEGQFLPTAINPDILSSHLQSLGLLCFINLQVFCTSLEFFFIHI